MPDLHSGYGFAIGNVAAFDMSLPEAVVSPGGVGFDINCGVRLIRTNLSESDVAPVREQLAQVRHNGVAAAVRGSGSACCGLFSLHAPRTTVLLLLSRS